MPSTRFPVQNLRSAGPWVHAICSAGFRTSDGSLSCPAGFEARPSASLWGGLAAGLVVVGAMPSPSLSPFISVLGDI